MANVEDFTGRSREDMQMTALCELAARNSWTS
jgi:hypothetical protein